MTPEIPPSEIESEDSQQLAKGRRTAAAYLSVAVIGGALVFFGTADQRRNNRNRSSCQSNLKLASLAISQYCRDWDEVLPRAIDWTDALQPYAKSQTIFQCPERGALPQGVALHSYAASMRFAVWDLPLHNVVWMFESGGQNRNSCDAGTSLVVKPRHLGGNNYAFGDGHIKWLVKADLKKGYTGNFYKRRAAEFARQALSDAASHPSRGKPIRTPLKALAIGVRRLSPVHRQY